MSNTFAVIMAGGIGTRFWPMSTKKFPKQFHDIMGSGSTLLQSTFDRMRSIVPVENIFVFTNSRYKDIVISQLPEIDKKNVVLEPMMRNTAPCAVYAAFKIRSLNPNAVIITTPSDHWIDDDDKFTENILTCAEVASKEDLLITLGIEPTAPVTGYGYINYDTDDQKAVKRVIGFKEKPNSQTAESFIRAGGYLWNAGIFVWRAQTIIDECEHHNKKLYEQFAQGESVYNTDREQEFIKSTFESAENISIDYAIIEKSKKIGVFPVNFGWDDLGSWSSLHSKLKKDENQNASIGAHVFFKGAKNNIVKTNSEKIVVIQGLEDFIVADNDNVLMIYPKEKDQEIKEFIKEVEENIKNSDLESINKDIF